MTDLPIPPFAKNLDDLQKIYCQPSNDVYIFMGIHSWKKASNIFRSHPTRTICLPPKTSPYRYRWPVGMCDILLFDTSETDDQLVDDLVAVLFKSGATKVIYISHLFDLSIFKRI